MADGIVLIFLRLIPPLALLAAQVKVPGCMFVSFLRTTLFPAYNFVQLPALYRRHFFRNTSTKIVGSEQSSGKKKSCFAPVKNVLITAFSGVSRLLSHLQATEHWKSQPLIWRDLTSVSSRGDVGSKPQCNQSNLPRISVNWFVQCS